MIYNIKILAVIIICIISVIVVNIYLPNPIENKELKNKFWVSKTHNTEKRNIIACGDSRVYRSVSINAIQQQLKDFLSGINLGYSGAGFTVEYLDFVLSKLDKQAKNKILILGISPHSLTLEACKNEHFLSYKNIGSFEVFKGLYLSQYLKYFAPYRPLEFVKGNLLINIQHFNPDGWVGTYRKKYDSTSSLANYKRIFNEYQVDTQIINTLLKKIEAIRKQQITVIAFRPPSTIEMREIENYYSGFNELEFKNQLKKLGVHWIDFADNDFESYDGSHVDLKSAEKLSKILGKKINQLCF